jgi:hypothetical protein
MLTIANWWRNKDDPDYQALEPWEKRANWYFKTPYTKSGWVVFPKPELLGTIFATLPEEIADHAYHRDPDMVKHVLRDLLPEVGKGEDNYRYVLPLIAQAFPDMFMPAMERDELTRSATGGRL